MSPTSQKQHLRVSTLHLDKLPNLHDVSHMIGHSWYIIDDVSYTIDHQWPIIHDIYIISYLMYHIWFSWMILHVRCIECNTSYMQHHMWYIKCDASNMIYVYYIRCTVYDEECLGSEAGPWARWPKPTKLGRQIHQNQGVGRCWGPLGGDLGEVLGRSWGILWGSMF